MTLESKVMTFTHGATPHVFDGEQKIVLSAEAERIVALICSHSLSAHTNDEGHGAALRLTGSSWAGNITWPFGWIIEAQTAANIPPQAIGQDIIDVDIPVNGGDEIVGNVSTILGAVQTGTVDATIGIVTDDGETPEDIIERIPQTVKKAGSEYGYVVAKTTAAEAALSTFTIPGWANEIVAGKFLRTVDTAVTADEELTGYMTLDLGVKGQGSQVWPTIGGIPQAGTDVGAGAAGNMPWIPMHIDISNINSSLTVTAKVKPKSAITGGADYACFLAWR